MSKYKAWFNAVSSPGDAEARTVAAMLSMHAPRRLRVAAALILLQKPERRRAVMDGDSNAMGADIGRTTRAAGPARPAAA